MNRLLSIFMIMSMVIGCDKKKDNSTSVSDNVRNAEKERSNQVAKVQVDFRVIEDAIQAFNVDNGRYPTGDEGLGVLFVNISDLSGWHGPYIKHHQLDPWRNEYKYVYPGQYNLNSYDVISAGPDGKFDTKDDLLWNQIDDLWNKGKEKP